MLWITQQPIEDLVPLSDERAIVLNNEHATAEAHRFLRLITNLKIDHITSSGRPALSSLMSGSPKSGRVCEILRSDS